MGNKITIAFMIAMTILVYIVVVSIQRISFLEQQEKLNRQSQEMMTLLSDLRSRVADAEMDEKVYSINLDDHFRERFNQSLSRINIIIRRLSDISLNNISQKKQIISLDSIVKRRMAALESLIEMNQSKELERVKLERATGEAKKLHNEMDIVVTQIVIEENRLLRISQINASRNVYFSVYSLFFGSLIILLFIGATFIINRSFLRRRRAEQKLSISENKLRTLIELLPVGVSVLDENKEITYLNPALEKILDITLTGILNGDYHHRQYLRSDGEIMQESEFASSIADRENREINNVETGIVKENGQVVWTNVSAVPVAFDDWHMIIVTADITERKLREEKLSQLAAIVESSENIILSKSLDGIITSWNKGAEALYGYTATEVIGKPVSILTPPGIEDVTIQFLAKIKSGTHIEHFETLRKTKGGNIIHVSLSISPIINGFGKIIGASTIGHNITKRKQMEEEVIQKNKQLMSLNIEKDKFLSIVAHDLRSPFNAFLGFTKILDEELSTLTMEEIQLYATNMRKSADKLFLFLENLLEWSSNLHGLGVFKSESFILLKVIDSSIDILRDAADKKMLEIAQEISEGLSLTADKHMFRSLIRNLVYNAIKFTPRGGKITIAARLLPDKSTEISIRDTGIGMNNEILEKLFHIDQYVNRIGTEDEPSSGLGLIICKEYVEKHGGKIWVNSEVGIGSTFYFTIPLINIKESKK